MKELSLTNSTLKALVSDEDYIHLSAYQWTLADNGYVKRDMLISIHSIIAEIIGLKRINGLQIDHKDRNKLNNQRDNLRLATRSQNLGNANKSSLPRSSKYKGVSWYKPTSKWKVSCQGQFIGYFKTEEAAAKAYNAQATKVFGDFANLNMVGI